MEPQYVDSAGLSFRRHRTAAVAHAAGRSTRIGPGTAAPDGKRPKPAPAPASSPVGCAPEYPRTPLLKRYGSIARKPRNLSGQEPFAHRSYAPRLEPTPLQPP